LLQGLLLRLAALLLHLRHAIEIVPADQDDDGQDDGEEQVLVIAGHGRSVSVPGKCAAANADCARARFAPDVVDVVFSARVARARSRSSTRAGKGAVRASRRATTTKSMSACGQRGAIAPSAARRRRRMRLRSTA